MSIDEQRLRSYMRGFHYGVHDRLIDATVKAPYPNDPEKERGYDAGRVAYAVAERVERQRMERAEREETWLQHAIESGNNTYVPEGGENIEDTIHMVRVLADRSGKAARATFNERLVVALPGDSAEMVWSRFNATAATEKVLD